LQDSKGEEIAIGKLLDFQDDDINPSNGGNPKFSRPPEGKFQRDSMVMWMPPYTNQKALKVLCSFIAVFLKAFSDNMKTHHQRIS